MPQPIFEVWYVETYASIWYNSREYALWRDAYKKSISLMRVRYTERKTRECEKQFHTLDLRSRIIDYRW